jgi:serine protease Do
VTPDLQDGIREKRSSAVAMCHLMLAGMLLAAVLVLLLRPALAQNSTSEASSGISPAGNDRLVVWCYDAKRDVVYRELSARCQGSVVSDAQAKEIQARRVHEIEKALARSQPPSAGRRLARIGTAFFVDPDGDLVTNNHVVDGCKAVTTEAPDGRSLAASVTAVDVYHDLALLHVDLGTVHLTIRSPSTALFRSQDLTESGAFVAAIGYPDQGLPPLEPVVTTGTLVGLPAHDPWGERLAMRGDIRHGNSGSPIVDRYGLVVGVINAKIDTVKWYRETGTVPPDIAVGLSQPIVLQFLQRHAIHYQFGQDGHALSPAQILATARSYVVRADCWE